ncbi:MAG: DUF3467 domain-containing protein [Methanosarcinales archaeon]|nr:DUF3467 domain-containing protein [Methanosarcinales archaeon]
MAKNNQKDFPEKKIDVNEPKIRYDYTFYSNVARATTSEVDAYIDFMQFPPVENITPAVRIYLSQTHLKQLFDMLSKMPRVSDREDEE